MIALICIPLAAVGWSLVACMVIAQRAKKRRKRAEMLKHLQRLLQG